jgi:hypothetical protein
MRVHKSADGAALFFAVGFYIQGREVSQGYLCTHVCSDVGTLGAFLADTSTAYAHDVFP